MDHPRPLPLVLPPGPVTRSFRAQVEAAVADVIEEGRTGALLAIAGAEGGTAVLATRVGRDWVLAGEVEWKWDGALTGRVVVTKDW